MGRNFGVRRVDTFMRHDLARQQFWSSFWAGLQIIVGLGLLLAVYGWVGAMDAKAEAEDGPTELVAKMRYFIASKMGDEVEIPEELK